MISYESQYIKNAHVLSDVKLASAVTTLYAGQWLVMNADGEWELSTGAANAKSYMTVSNKYGNPVDNINRPITAGPAGRDNVTSTGLAAVLIGPYRIATDQYENAVYNAGAALKVSDNGKLTPLDGGDDASLIVAWVFTPPAEVGAPMTIVHE